MYVCICIYVYINMIPHILTIIRNVIFDISWAVSMERLQFTRKNDTIDKTMVWWWSSCRNGANIICKIRFDKNRYVCIQSDIQKKNIIWVSYLPTNPQRINDCILTEPRQELVYGTQHRGVPKCIAWRRESRHRCRCATRARWLPAIYVRIWQNIQTPRPCRHVH